MRVRARILPVATAVIVIAALVPGASGIQPTFREVRRADGIGFNNGTDVCGGTNHWGFSLTGSAGAAGDNWIAVLDGAPNDDTPTSLFGDVTVRADVLIRPFNNSKGGGVLARFNQDHKGLALTISNAGNTDRLLLGTVSAGSPAFTTLASANLNGQINQCAWYQVNLYVGNQQSTFAWGTVWSHVDPSNPNSSLDDVLGSVEIPAAPDGILATGEIGFFGRATLAVEDTTIANWFGSPPV
jgi:hypothetical protein